MAGMGQCQVQYPLGKAKESRLTMRHIVLLLLVAVTIVAAMVPAGVVFAESLSDPIDNGNPSCFGAYAGSEPGPQTGPGESVSDLATFLAEPGTPESGTDEVASQIGLLQQVRQDVCPADQPLEQ